MPLSGLKIKLGKTCRVFPLIFCVWFGLPAVAADDAPGLTIHSASTHLEKGVYLLDAQLEYVLSKVAIEALDSGVSLTFDLDIEVYKPRKWVWNDTVASLSQRYRIVYHALSKQYIVTNLNSGVQNSYASRNTALLTMGRIENIPLIDKKLLGGEGRWVRIRLSLAINELPAPLRPWAYINSDWRLKSEWFEWQLK